MIDPRPERDPASVALGLAVRWLREERDWPREVLAHRAELTPDEVEAIEGGAAASVSTLFALAEALDVPAAELVAAAERLMA